MKYYFLSLRPHQWTKNLLLFAALIFSKNFFHKELFLKTAEGFFIFSLIAGHVYIINDIIDREKDRIHPKKKNRPIAAGKLNVKTAIILTSLFLPLLFFLSFKLLGKNFFLTIFAYFLLQILYSFSLKNVVILDVFVISLGFLLRVLAGVVIINVPLSNWLLLCSFWLALFLALGKRRSELQSLKEGKIASTRKSLQFYSLPLINTFITIISSATILSYALYTIDPLTIQKFKTDKLLWTLPFVLYGLFRYLYLLYEKNDGETPELVLLKDPHIYLTVIGWLVFTFFLIY